MKIIPNLLIVDDVEDNLYLLLQIISKVSVNVISAHSGAEALAKSRGLPLALAIIDVRMPVMDGFELAIKINEGRHVDKVPVIFLTAIHSAQEEVFKGYSLGAIDYITKPFNIHILLSKIHAFLEFYKQKQLLITKTVKLKKTAERLSMVNSALIKSEEKYRSYIEHAPHGIFITDQDGRYIQVNQAACRITGFSEDELLRISIPELLAQESLIEGLNQFQIVAETGSSKYDLMFNHKNGTKRWWRVSAVKLSDTRFLGFTEDITQRKEIENQLRSSQAELEMQNEELFIAKERAEHANVKYRNLYNYAPIGYLTLSREQVIIDLNLSATILLGSDRRELVGRNFEPFISRDTTGNFNVFFMKIFERKVKETVEVILDISANNLKYVHIEGLYLEQGDQCVLNILDLTDRKLAENTLKISEEKYRTMVNNSPDGILLINMRGIISEVSEIALEILGAENLSELVGKHFYKFVPSDEKNTMKGIFEKTINDGICQNIQIKIKKINKAPFLTETSTTLIQDSNGQPLSFMIIIRDISYRKKMEVMQIHADRMANLGQMAAGMAHEINQPLNVISTVMDGILFETTRTETFNIEFFKNKSEKIFQNIIRIRNIIDHVRAFSRSQNDFITTAFDINASIENAVSMIDEQFKHLGINLTLHLDRQISPFIGNTYQFEQVIINLLINAKDAVIEKKINEGEDSDLKIKITTRLEGRHLIIEVSDNGIGIGKDELQNIVLPFYTTKTEGKGTGLGLSICYQIIKGMGGTIDINNNVGAGTTVKIALTIIK